MKAIVIVDEKWGIAKNGDQPFYIPEDLKFFKEKTLGKVVVMGRGTLAALPRRLKFLPDRINVVLTRQRDFVCRGVVIRNSIEDLEFYLAGYAPEDVFVIGGAEIYEQLLERCSKVYVTKVFADAECDKFFPNLDRMDEWKCVKSSAVSVHNSVAYWFREYERVDSGEQ
jgi:dihydrofolate reductase